MITDLGERCDRHSGETYLPRCYECTTLQVHVHQPTDPFAQPVDNSTLDLVTNALASWGLTSAKGKTHD